MITLCCANDPRAIWRLPVQARPFDCAQSRETCIRTNCMSTHMTRKLVNMDRREFIQSASAAAAAAAVPDSRSFVESPISGPMVGIQVGAVSFVDEGVERCMDVFQQDGGINTLFIATFTYGRGIAGRQVPGQPLPDHGKQKYDTDTFHGGCYTKVDPKYFANTPFKDFRAPDLGDFDVLEAVLPLAKRRGLKTICWFEDVFRKDLPGIDQLQEKELSGQNAVTNCFNNPNYRNWLLGMVENWASLYDIDGIMWGSERQGRPGEHAGCARRRCRFADARHMFLSVLRG
jgi:hypothetical protein